MTLIGAGADVDDPRRRRASAAEGRRATTVTRSPSPPAEQVPPHRFQPSAVPSRLTMKPAGTMHMVVAESTRREERQRFMWNAIESSWSLAGQPVRALSRRG